MSRTARPKLALTVVLINAPTTYDDTLYKSTTYLLNGFVWSEQSAIADVMQCE